jgi:hypothetical protein
MSQKFSARFSRVVKVNEHENCNRVIKSCPMGTMAAISSRLKQDQIFRHGESLSSFLTKKSFPFLGRWRAPQSNSGQGKDYSNTNFKLEFKMNYFRKRII